MPDKPLPKYRDLPQIDERGDRHAWGVFGKTDELGAINLLTSERVLRALKTVRKGKVFNLSLPLNVPNPPISSTRQLYRHEAWAMRPTTRDDKLDNFYMQYSSQWDSFRHIRYRDTGFYNGFTDEDFPSGALGIQRFAEHGIVGRGVVADVEGHFRRKGMAYNPATEVPIDERLLQEIFEGERITVERGDILLLRTGWMGYYLGLSQEGRAALAGKLKTTDDPDAIRTPGLKATQAVAAYLWDSGFAALAADNPGVESAPGSAAIGNLHRRVIPLLGIPFAELWNLEALAADCAQDGVYECLLVSIPLNLPGGVGSPANAIAIR